MRLYASRESQAAALLEGKIIRCLKYIITDSMFEIYRVVLAISKHGSPCNHLAEDTYHKIARLNQMRRRCTSTPCGRVVAPDIIIHVVHEITQSIKVGCIQYGDL